MKRALFASAAFLVVNLLASCEATNSLRAGGGAFDDSELARKLDANSHIEDPSTPGDRSFEEWRNAGR